MTKHIVLRQLFIPGIFLLECHLPLGLAELHLSGSPSGGAHLPGWPADTLPTSGVLPAEAGDTRLCVWRTDGCSGWHGDLLFWIRNAFHFSFRDFLACLDDYYSFNLDF